MTIRNVSSCITAIAFLLSISASTDAGPYTDALSKCLVRSTTPSDKNYLIKWMFAAMASHPEVRTMASISDREGAELNAGMAQMLETLLLESCRTEAKEAFQYEGQSTLEASFAVLGSVAARGLMTHADVAAYTDKLEEYIDAEKIEAALRAQ